MWESITWICQIIYDFGAATCYSLILAIYILLEKLSGFAWTHLRVKFEPDVLHVTLPPHYFRLVVLAKCLPVILVLDHYLQLIIITHVEPLYVYFLSPVASVPYMYTDNNDKIIHRLNAKILLSLLFHKICLKTEILNW